MLAISQILAQGFETQNVSLKPLMMLAGLNRSQTAELLHVSEESINRWERTGKPNPTASKLLAIMAGYLPWTKWRGWKIHSGQLFAPGQFRYGISASMIENMIILRQYKDTLETENQALKAEIEKLRGQEKAPVLRLVK